MVDAGKLKKEYTIFIWEPHLCCQDAMRLAKFSDEEIADVALCHFH
jgi:hypothetical protein